MTSSPPQGLARFSYTQYHMGIDARIVVYAKSEKQAQEACTAAFARIGELDAIMSDYRKDSELNRLSDAAGGPPVTVSAPLFAVLRRAQEVSRRSGGAFDVTIGPLVALWRVARRTARLPDTAALAEAQALVGWEKMRLDERQRTVQLLVRGMRLDLGGIAKGYAADEAQRVLKGHGINSAMVEMGGDLVVSAAPPGSPGWLVEVPNAGDDYGPAKLYFAHRAISTSGDTEQFVVIDGVQYSHVVDPRTGMALRNRVQATVVAPDGLTADPVSTTMTVLEPHRRRAFLNGFRGSRCYIRELRVGVPSILP